MLEFKLIDVSKRGPCIQEFIHPYYSRLLFYHCSYHVIVQDIPGTGKVTPKDISKIDLYQARSKIKPREHQCVDKNMFAYLQFWSIPKFKLRHQYFSAILFE